MKLEREVKLAAWGGFVLPALDDVAPDVTVEALKTKKLDATYYDTRDLRLARAGVSLRHRVGDDPPWTVKLPGGRRRAGHEPPGDPLRRAGRHDPARRRAAGPGLHAGASRWWPPPA